MKKTQIVAAWCGAGKTFICENLNQSAIEIEYWKYKDIDELGYIRDIESSFGKYDWIFISTDPAGLKPIIELGYDILLVYPKKELREEYLDRYINRGSSADFIGPFMKWWSVWLDELRQQRGCKHLTLNKGEYLSDVLNSEIKYEFI